MLFGRIPLEHDLSRSIREIWHVPWIRVSFRETLVQGKKELLEHGQLEGVA